MAEQHQWTPEEVQALTTLGLSITPHSDPHLSWGYTWLGRDWAGGDWAGPFSTPGAALHAAFTDALLALKFRSDHSWVLFAQPGELWRFDGGEEWVHIAGEDQPRGKKPKDIEAKDAEEQARQDWSNDE